MSFHHHSPKRNRRSVSQPKSAFDSEINVLYESIIKKQQSGYSQEEFYLIIKKILKIYII